MERESSKQTHNISNSVNCCGCHPECTGQKCHLLRKGIISEQGSKSHVGGSYAGLWKRSILAEVTAGIKSLSRECAGHISGHERAGVATGSG